MAAAEKAAPRGARHRAFGAAARARARELLSHDDDLDELPPMALLASRDASVCSTDDDEMAPGVRAAAAKRPGLVSAGAFARVKRMPEQTPQNQAPCAAGAQPVTVGALPRCELQRLAKQHGIRANMSSAAIAATLATLSPLEGKENAPVAERATASLQEPSPLPVAPAAASSHAAEFATRLAWTAEASRGPRDVALTELAAGRKRGHWVWWVFPTLAQRGGDANSARQHADLMSVDEAEAYASHAELRNGLVASFDAASTAFGAAAAGGATQVTWLVLDSGFGRAADGMWVAGPVDAFKLRCSATLFGALAQRAGDAALLEAARRVLGFFTADGVVYTAAGRGTAGHSAPAEGVAPVPARNVLRGCDKATLKLLRRAGQEAAAFEAEVAAWEEVFSCDP